MDEMQTIDWGPVSAWAGVIATLLVIITTSLVALGWFDRFRAPRIRIVFADEEPWRRTGRLADGTTVEWVRLGVENVGRSSASGCVGRLLSVTTADHPRTDVDPVQLRWAGVPRGRAFDPIDLRPGQREFLNIVHLPSEGNWRLVTFESPDFDPGFATDLARLERHRLDVAVFAGNDSAAHATLELSISESGPLLRLVH